jgi:hypothetical protein
MSRNVKPLADQLGAEIVGLVPDVGGGAFAASHLAHVVAALRTQPQDLDTTRSESPNEGASEVGMDLKPFIQLPARRMVNRPEFPPDLSEFYAEHEGIGLERSPEYPLRLCRLDEVKRIGWKGLRSLWASADHVPEGWNGFAGFWIGLGSFGEEIVYVLDAPCCPTGSILALGGCAPGPGGTGPYCLEASLVLALSLQGWLAHLKRWDWVAYVVAGAGDLPRPQQDELTRYYLVLNPSMNVG